MPLITSEQLVRPLPHQANLYVLASALTHKVHRYNRRSRNRLLQTPDDVAQLPLKHRAADSDARVLRFQNPRRLFRIGQFIVSEALAVADRKRMPVRSILVHQCEQKSRVNAAAQKQPQRNVADQLAPYCLSI